MQYPFIHKNPDLFLICSKKYVNLININVWRKHDFDIYFTEFGAVMTTLLSVLFKYCYK